MHFRRPPGFSRVCPVLCRLITTKVARVVCSQCGSMSNGFLSAAAADRTEANGQKKYLLRKAKIVPTRSRTIWCTILGLKLRHLIVCAATRICRKRLRVLFAWRKRKANGRGQLGCLLVKHHREHNQHLGGSFRGCKETTR